MLYFAAVALALASGAVADFSNPVSSFKPGTGTRSLFIPFKTASDVQASILGVDLSNNQTTYVLACPTSSPTCALAPNLTLTEGPTLAEYVTSATGGVATLKCALNTTLPIVCNQIARGASDDGDVAKTSTTLTAASEVNFQKVTVTGTMNATTSTSTSKTSSSSTSTSSTSSSTGGMATVTAVGPWAMGGAAAAGLMALAAL